MKKLPKEKNECTHQTIERGVINSSIDFHNIHGEYSLPSYFHSVMALLAEKIYEVAPSCANAEELFQDALNEAKERYLNK